ncbi:RNA polymerase sigma factor SigZ [Photobacterium kasasachensis]|uniref:RNA polymerase sigma factor SigZ n=1 Tax=Photobacterium kasasachensis TaxID=2910240 RepID=UPI003D12C516
MLSEWLKHKEQLRRYVARYVDDTHATEDILQDVYIKASMSFHQLKSKSSIKSWLYRITHNVIMDFYRSQKIYDELFEDVVEERVPEEEANLLVIGQCLRPMLQCLPEKYRVPLTLAELEGMTQQEIANKLNLSLSGVKSRVQRGRQQFKELLINYCNIESGREGIIDFYPEPECKHLANMATCQPR